jgi:glycosyltransferase involved in cell wall biosynthesis
MKAFTSAAPAWPPFPVQHLPIELQGLLEDFHWAAMPSHQPLTSPLLTVVVPCYNPDPQQFAQLLLSLRQQCDQAFELLLVNDGSSDAVWSLIQPQLESCPWIRVLHQPGNTGISAALNAALEQVSSPFVALVDQDDILHPGAIALVRRYLEAHPDCGLLYSDHLVFDDTGATCQYIPKFPWNPEALLEFNFLIHLTVVRADLYRACGGMNSRFDGIQDWEFYLRLVPHLASHEVGYLPVPLYAWRLSDRSVASSAQPKVHLLERAGEFLREAHLRWGAGTQLAQLDAPSNHYRFHVDRAGAASQADIQVCNVLVSVADVDGSADPSVIEASVRSVVDSGIPIARLLIALERLDLDGCSSLSRCDWSGLTIRGIEPEFLTGSLVDIADQLPVDAPLLALQAGARLSVNLGWRDLPRWLESNDHWDLLTLPGFDEASDSCVSAGYSSVTAHQAVYFPHAQGLSREAYMRDFSSFGHTRAVDLPSPFVQLLSRHCLSATLEAFRRLDPSADLSLPSTWWGQFGLLSWRCGCPADVTVELSPALAAAERSRVACQMPEGMVLTSAATWLGSQGHPWMLAYGSLLDRVLAEGAGRAHPLYVYALLACSQHPTVLHVAERSTPRFSLLPPIVCRPVVMLIPTELNPRSNGHACMLALALQLQEAGHTVHLLPFKPYTFFEHYYQKLPAACRKLSFIADPMEAQGSVLLAPESAPRELVNHLRGYYHYVLWWLLAPAGLLTTFRPDIRVGDRLVAFSEFALPKQSRYLFVHPPSEAFLKKLAASHTPHNSHSSQVAIYTGKGRLKPLPRSLHRHLLAYRVVLITRSVPATKQDLVHLLARSNGLISFDPMSNLSLEAANLGVPAFLPGNPFPPRCYRCFPVDLRPFITDSAGNFIAQLKNRKPRRKLSLSLLDRASTQASAFLALLTADPEPVAAQPFSVTDDTLQQIEYFRQQLVHSRTIQTHRAGQSVSSAFGLLYVRSMKAPYVLHRALCQVLACLDQFGDVLAALGLFRLLWPLLTWFGAPVRAFQRRFS